MLGVALLHLLPHSLAQQASIDQRAAWMLGGLVTMFLLIRVFHVHAHEHGDTSDLIDIQHTSDEGSCEHHHEHHEHVPGQHPFSWVGLGLGLSLHTLIDGVALAPRSWPTPMASTSFACSDWEHFWPSPYISRSTHFRSLP